MMGAVSTESGEPLPPSGRQHELAHGDQRAVVTEVGATLRAYSVGGAAVVDGFGVDEMASGGHGQVLAPWPNRLGDGRYTFEGRAGRAPLDEPERSNAIHGLVRWLGWSPVEQSTEAVRLRAVLEPQPAYPWRLALEIEYRLGDTGLTVTTTATNVSTARAPFGIGFHPYLTVGTTRIDDAVLLVPGRRRLLADDRGLPVGEDAVAGTEYDFTTSRPVGDVVLDTAYADLGRDAEGRAAAVLTDPDGGRRAALWMDRDFRYLMVFTGDTLGPDSRRRSVALEPMTCPPDALRSGRDLIVLDPAGQWRGAWGIDAR
jgi:aldose 1-epimerase